MGHTGLRTVTMSRFNTSLSMLLWLPALPALLAARYLSASSLCVPCHSTRGLWCVGLSQQNIFHPASCLQSLLLLSLRCADCKAGYGDMSPSGYCNACPDGYISLGGFRAICQECEGVAWSNDNRTMCSECATSACLAFPPASGCCLPACGLLCKSAAYNHVLLQCCCSENYWPLQCLEA